jgi:ankyrin repeat protein
MLGKRTKPFDMPTLLLAVVPVLIIAALTAFSFRSSKLHGEFMKAAHRGDVKLLTRLLNEGAAVNDQDPSGATALGYAANGRHVGAVQLLLAHGANVKAMGGNEFNAPLATACLPPFDGAPAKPNDAVMRLLLDHGADPREAGKDWRLPLEKLVDANDGASLRLLIEHGANINIQSDQGTPLYHAVMLRNTLLAKLLLAKGANPDIAEDNTGETPLIRAVENDDVVLVKALLSSKARTDKRDKLGQSALQWARKGKDRKLVALLIAAGAK